MQRTLTLLCLLTSAALPLHAQLDKTRGGAVVPSNFNSRYTLQSATPENLRWVPDPTGSNRTVLQATVRDSDAKVFGGLRTEIIPMAEYTPAGVRWYAISAYFPTSWQPHPYPAIIGQIHTSQKTATLSPPVAFVVHGQNLDLELYANHRAPQGGDPATRANSALQVIRLDRLKTGQWYCFVVRADWSPQPGQGSLKIWMNADKVYEATNLYNSYETWLGNYPKAGLYMPGMMGVTERMIYLDFIHVGGPKMGFDEMAMKTPCQTSTAGVTG
jgi:hypothetical protein